MWEAELAQQRPPAHADVQCDPHARFLRYRGVWYPTYRYIRYRGVWYPTQLFGASPQRLTPFGTSQDLTLFYDAFGASAAAAALSAGGASAVAATGGVGP